MVFRSGTGTKVFGPLREGVSFETDGHDAGRASTWSVVVRGVAHEIQKGEQLVAPVALPIFPWHQGPRPRFVRIEPTLVKGRRVNVGPAPAS